MSTFTNYAKLFLVYIFVFSTTIAQAYSQENSPYTELESIGHQLFTRIAASQQELKKFPQYMRVIVEEELMPSIDDKYVAYKLLGKHLSKVSKEQRKEFSASIRHYLIKTYATALNQYKNQQVIFEPAKPTNGKRIIAVNTKVIEKDRPDLNIVFKMRQNKKTKQWKSFDMVVEGVSLLSSKQAEINSQIAKKGINQVTLELASIKKY